MTARTVAANKAAPARARERRARLDESRAAQEQRQDVTAATVTSLPDHGGSEDAARRAG